VYHLYFVCFLCVNCVCQCVCVLSIIHVLIPVKYSILKCCCYLIQVQSTICVCVFVNVFFTDSRSNVDLLWSRSLLCVYSVVCNTKVGIPKAIFGGAEGS
jgi:hypothetical protein